MSPWSIIALTGAACGRTSFDIALDAALVDAMPRDAQPDRPNVAFVTSTYHQGNFGAITADSICQTRANTAGLDGQFVALVNSSLRLDSSLPFAGSSGWRTVGGEWIANTRQQLVQEQFFNPLFRSEANMLLTDANVWKGTTSLSCMDWSNATAAATGVNKFLAEWGDTSNFDSTTTCDDMLRIACFERGHNATRPIPLITNRLIFVSKSLWGPNPDGRAGADAVCQLEANQASLVGTFVALLPLSGETALSRVNQATTAVFQRTDGEIVGSLASPSTFIMLDAKGNPATGATWTGGLPNQVAAKTCMSWSSPTTEGSAGTAGYVGDLGYSDTALGLDCSLRHRLYCVQQ
jgi:hypothetical protein